MKIEIHNAGQTNDYRLFEEGNNRPLQNYRNNFICPFDFSDQDIFWLIGEKNYDGKFQTGTYIFNVAKHHLQLITVERHARNRTELVMYND